MFKTIKFLKKKLTHMNKWISFVYGLEGNDCSNDCTAQSDLYSEFNPPNHKNFPKNEKKS